MLGPHLWGSSSTSASLPPAHVVAAQATTPAMPTPSVSPREQDGKFNSGLTPALPDTDET